MAEIGLLVADLAAEQAALVDVLGGLTDGQWRAATPAPGWTVAHQVAHLTYFDEAAATAISDPDGFAKLAARADADAQRYGAEVLEHYLMLPPTALLHAWRTASATFAAAATQVPADLRIPWFGPPMRPASKVTARLMETWAHGQDVRDTFGMSPCVSDRLRHVVHLAVRTRPYSYRVRALEPDATPVRLELEAPDGDAWTWGPESANDVVRGTALEFCLVLTRRRHVLDTDLRAEGSAAQQWLELGQTFAGDPGPGRTPGQFAAASTTSHDDQN
jgi:uncharacterized protein (TIGR03084 family)